MSNHLFGPKEFSCGVRLAILILKFCKDSRTKYFGKLQKDTDLSQAGLLHKELRMANIKIKYLGIVMDIKIG